MIRVLALANGRSMREEPVPVLRNDPEISERIDGALSAARATVAVSFEDVNSVVRPIGRRCRLQVASLMSFLVRAGKNAFL